MKSRSDFYLPEFHGRVFTRSEILSIVKRKGYLEKDWHPGLPPFLGARQRSPGLESGAIDGYIKIKENCRLFRQPKP